jgi:hypothetical protein
MKKVTEELFGSNCYGWLFLLGLCALGFILQSLPR